MAVGLFVFIFSFIQLVIGNEEGFIVGGDFVGNIKQFPHVAFLELTGKDGVYICGSSILNQWILVTAAHCLDSIKAITAHVGSINREQGQPFQVANFEQHPKWDIKTLTHDIGLCKVKRPLQFGRTVKRVLLMRNPPKTRTADLAGWGAIEERDYTDSIMLKHTVQKLWDHKQCRTVLYNAPKGTICGGESRAQDFASNLGDKCKAFHACQKAPSTLFATVARRLCYHLLLRSRLRMMAWNPSVRVFANIPDALQWCGSPNNILKRLRRLASNRLSGDSGSGLLVQNKIMVGLVSYKDVSVSRSLVVYTDAAHYYDWIVKTSRRLSCS